jgi:hypothetical protein
MCLFLHVHSIVILVLSHYCNYVLLSKFNAEENHKYKHKCKGKCLLEVKPLQISKHKLQGGKKHVYK